MDTSLGLPSYDIVGLPDVAVKESRERVRSAIKNSGFKFPTNKIKNVLSSLLQPVSEVPFPHRIPASSHSGTTVRYFPHRVIWLSLRSAVGRDVAGVPGSRAP